MNKATLFLAAIALFAGLTTGFLLRAAMRQPPEMASSKNEEHKHDATTNVKPDGLQKNGAGTPMPTSSGKIKDIKNGNCPIMGGEVDAESFFIIYNGLLIRFCCPGCDGQFLERPLELLKEMRDSGADIPMASFAAAKNPAVIDSANTSCPVTGREVGDSDIYVVHHGVKVHLCCGDCRSSFFEKPDELLARAAGSGSIPADRLNKEQQ